MAKLPVFPDRRKKLGEACDDENADEFFELFTEEQRAAMEQAYIDLLLELHQILKRG